MSPRLWRAASLELGWDMQMQPVPSEATEQRAASCTHPLSCAGNLKARASPAGLTHVYACVRLTCARKSCRAATFPLGTLLHLPSLHLSSSLLSPFPLLQHTFVLLSLPLFLLPSLFQPQLFLSAPSCVLRLRLGCEPRASSGRCCWCYSCLGSMSPSGPTEEDKTARELSSSEKNLQLLLFSRGQLSFPDCGIKWGFKRLRKN